ncbi:chromate efflux transporter [Pseudomonas profundi]|uniref:chromate efflux transporter n=1 Tax=Pseudomonas profundi TaxID=1981513 RepID=UPI00123BB9B6|nr:chromate efflux transporter [Pseudomonas profundi]
MLGETRQRPERSWQIFVIFLRLGLTSFGGPVAHLGYFREAFVIRRRWLSEKSYADVVALCQFLPGPASSQVGMALGLMRGGYPGMFAAWCGFTLPSALLLIAFALGLSEWGEAVPGGMLDGLKIAAVAVVAQAVWGMGRNLCPDRQRVGMMAVATCIVLLANSPLSQIAVIVLAAIIGTLLFKPAVNTKHETLPVMLSRGAGTLWLSLFGLLLLGLPVLAGAIPSQSLALIDAFYRSGSLVFGGGHVVLPLLQAEVVPTGWVDGETFLAGYGAAQAVPGPLFTFAGFLGAAMNHAPSGWPGGVIALLAIFLPSFLLIAGALPFWEALRTQPRAQAALMGINAAVVGLLLAALYDPVWTSAIHSPADFALALLALTALTGCKLPSWLVVLGCGGIGIVL